MTFVRETARPSILAAVLRHALRASLASAAIALGVVAAPVAAQTAGFAPVGTYGAYRLDGVRDAVHEGARVRLVDMTLHNMSTETTFPEAIQTVWWQGRHNGDKVDARRRDLSRFGMYDFVKPGQVIEVTYIMPVRDDIDGIRVDYAKAPVGQRERRWTWDELMAGGPGVPFHKGRPVGAVAPAAVPAGDGVTPAAAPAEAHEPESKTLDPGRLKGLKEALPGMPGLLKGKLKGLPF